MSITEIFAQYPYLITIIWVAIIAVVALILERLSVRWVKKFIRKSKIPTEVGNGLILTTRLLILAGAIIALLNVGGVPSDILVSFSALGGAAVGFASTRTIGNLIAGLYLLVTRPFRVGDYVKIDGTEGIVKEISVNYAKILTPQNTVISISTQKILDKQITNYRFKGEEESKLYCFELELNFDHSLSTSKLEEVFEKIIKQYEGKLPRKPEYKMTKLTRNDKNYSFYIYVKNPAEIFTLKPQLLKDITTEWEKVKAQKSK